jgi:hypothetical protein
VYRYGDLYLLNDLQVRGNKQRLLSNIFTAGCCTCSYYAKERTFATLHVVQQSLNFTVLGFSNWGSTSLTAGLAL